MSKRTKRRPKRKSRRVLVSQNPKTPRPVANHRLDRSGAYGFATYPVAKLSIDGIVWGEWPGPDDEVGYAMQLDRGDDCLQAAVATCTQTPIEQVPDLGVVERYRRGEDVETISALTWERLHSWAHKRGLELIITEELPPPIDPWIGVVQPIRRDEYLSCEDRSMDRGDGWGSHPFQDHCLVMRGERVWFDPVIGVRVPMGARGPVAFSIEHVSYAIAFERINNG